jgi:hypothetical protein
MRVTEAVDSPLLLFQLQSGTRDQRTIRRLGDLKLSEGLFQRWD